MRIRVLLLLLALNSAAQASNFTVTNANDIGPGSLRQAITDANADPNEPHTIRVQATGGSSFDIVLQSVLPTVTRSLTLTSDQPSTLIRIPAAGFLRFTRLGGGEFRMSNLRVFRDSSITSTIDRGGCLRSADASGVNDWTMIISNVEFTNCAARSTSGDAQGGAIYNNGDTEIVDTVIRTSNVQSLTARAQGSAIYLSGGRLDLTRVRIVFNGSSGQTEASGAVHVAAGTTLVALDSEFANNLTTANNNITRGGAVTGINANVSLARVSFTGHNAEIGTAVLGDGGVLHVENASFYRNFAPLGSLFPGAVTAAGDVSVRHSAFWDNTAHLVLPSASIVGFSGNVFVEPNLCAFAGGIPAAARANFGTGSCADGPSFSAADPRVEAFGRVAPTDAVPVITFGDGSPVRDAYGLAQPSTTDFNLPGEVDARLQNRPRDDDGDGLAEADAGPTEGARLIRVFQDGFE